MSTSRWRMLSHWRNWVQLIENMYLSVMVMHAKKIIHSFPIDLELPQDHFFIHLIESSYRSWKIPCVLGKVSPPKKKVNGIFHAKMHIIKNTFLGDKNLNGPLGGGLVVKDLQWEIFQLCFHFFETFREVSEIRQTAKMLLGTPSNFWRLFRIPDNCRTCWKQKTRKS